MCVCVCVCVSQVSTDEDGFSLEATEAGRIMVQHYIALNTMVRVLAYMHPQSCSRALACHSQALWARQSKPRQFRAASCTVLRAADPRPDLQARMSEGI